jgi:hypothetical protein
MNRAAPSREGKGFGVVGRFSVNLHRRECRYPGSRSVPAFSPSAEHFSRCAAFELDVRGGLRVDVREGLGDGPVSRGDARRELALDPARARQQRLDPAAAAARVDERLRVVFFGGMFPTSPATLCCWRRTDASRRAWLGDEADGSSDVGGVSTTSRSEHMSSAASMSSSLTTRRR